jgi:biofilm PGA synthesis N-glycosyltransferase PgaC
MSQKEQPVFFDQTGKRWRKTKWLLGISLVGIVVVLAVLLPALAEPVSLPAAQSAPAADIGALEDEFDTRNVPVLGKGQFIRAAKIKREGSFGGLYDALSGKFIRDLTKEEVVEAASSRYAILRYGQVPDKTMVLTFDDGPDPAYTPRLLDILSKHEVPATFFVVGSNAVKYPEIVQREVREGHLATNHTFGHLDFDYGSAVQGEQEINQTSRVLAAATGRRSSLMRVPYAGSTDQSLRDSIKGILQAQQLGYTPVAYDYDTRDWAFKADTPPDKSLFDGQGKILLLHDSGGDRSHTLNYVSKLIPMAKDSGYDFVNLAQVEAGRGKYASVESTNADKAAFALGHVFLVLPASLVFKLFAFNIALIILVTGSNIVLASLHRRRMRRKPLADARAYQPSVSVVVPAHNEGDVLENSVRSVLDSKYLDLEVTIVDDGSQDDTFRVAKRLAGKNLRVSAIRQDNKGKAAALNNGISHSSGAIIICIDADTLFARNTIQQLVRNFRDPKVGGVAGYVRAGNARNWVTKWQALEYITSISLERGAQAFLNAVTVVPGACGAWRREALEAAGGFSDNTLAEDCDVALAVHRAGYTITQDTTAISYTECPLTLGDLAKQRFRWTFGNIQSFWKHRRMFFNKNHGWLGMFVLPNAALSVLMPMLFWPLLLGLAIANITAGRWWVIALFMGLFMGLVMALQFIVAFVGLVLSREKFHHILASPLTRLVYSPLRTYILYRSLLTVLRGALVSWNKVNRTKTVTDPGHARSFQAVRQPSEE